MKNKIYIVAVRIEGKNQLFEFYSKKDMNSFIKRAKKIGLEYSFTEILK